MKNSIVTRLGLAVMLTYTAFLGGCQSPVEPEKEKPATVTKVTGKVVRSDNSSPVADAIVADTRGLPSDTTGTDGTFELSYQISADYVGRIIARKTLFQSDTADIFLTVGKDTTIEMVLGVDSTSPPPGVSTGKPASIVLVSSSDVNVSIRGTGLNETVTLIFEVRDSLGVPVGGANKATVLFRINGGPGGGEYIYPASAVTDPATGRVTTRITSGTRAGVLQVFATVYVDSVNYIQSTPVRVTISGGMPSPSHFSISAEKLNIAGGVFDNLRDRVTVIVGDREGNPVPAGTAVYFTTTGGIIQPSAVTNADGVASVDLITANPRPSGGGLVTVTARTIGDTSLPNVTSSRQILFSGATRIITPGNFAITDTGQLELQFRVSDVSGFPLVKGSVVTTKLEGLAAGDVELTGNTEYTFEDSQDPSTTYLRVRLRDKVAGGLGGAVTLRITVKSQNGNAEATIDGVIGAGQTIDPGPIGGENSGYAATLTLLNITKPSVSVRGAGEDESTRLTFIARDSLGNPVALNRRAGVTFTLYGPGGGEFIFPPFDSTSANGTVSTVLTSGTTAGVVQVVASAMVNGRTITSAPTRITISGGLPDDNHFTARLSTLNMRGLVSTGPLGDVKIQLGDQFGNPVQKGTALYFSISGGLIQPFATTDDNGNATVTISGGNPEPSLPGRGAGYGIITVQTLGLNGTVLRKQLPFLFSGAPEISVLSPALPAPVFRRPRIAKRTVNDELSRRSMGAQDEGPLMVYTGAFGIDDGGSQTFTYTVADKNGNPVAGGNQVSVSVSGTGASEVTLSGQTQVTFTDDTVRGRTYSFTLTDNAPGSGKGGEVEITISASGPSGTAVKKIVGAVGAAGDVTSGYASSLTLQTIETQQIAVRGTGENETTRLTFIAKDSLGNPVSLNRKIGVTFSLTGPGGGEFITPISDSTKTGGLVSTTLTSGTQAGVVQVIASATVNGRTINSAPTRITISGGLPDSNRFTVNLTPLNMRGLVSTAQLGQVEVQLGDQFGNPVQAGTALSFSTTGGMIPASATTDASGKATVTISGGNPEPTTPGRGAGYGKITVQTIGAGGITLKKEIPFLFSGAPIVNTPVSYDGFAISDGGSQTFTYTVADKNGNPVAGGNQVSVSVSGTGASEVTLSGQTQVTFTDDTVRGRTYSFTLTDNAPGSGKGGEVEITISASGLSGTAVKKIVGAVGAAGDVTSGYASSLTLQTIETQQIAVRGTGENETTRLTFIAKDSLGNPVSLNRKIGVTFSLTGPGGGEFITPISDSTKTGGLVSTTLTSGTQAGVVQVIASATVNGRTINSAPTRITISGGLPDSNRFTVNLTPLNMRGLVSTAQLGQVEVQLGDQFGNPVQAGTALSFSTTGGMIPASATTDASGKATVTISGGNPEPTTPGRGAGYGKITVQTIGAGGITLKKEIPFLFSGAPIVNTPVSYDGFAISDGGSQTFTYTVADKNGNPVAGGNQVSVSVSGTGASEVTLSGQTQVTFTDDTVRGRTYSFTLTDNAPGSGKGGEVEITISASGPSGTAVKKILGSVVEPLGGYTASLTLQNISSPSISVRGTGENESTTLTYIAKDSLGNPVKLDKKATVSFILTGPGGGEYIYPTTTVTNADGTVSTTLHSGTMAGVVQVIATTTVGGRTINSAPTRVVSYGGLPVDNAFTAQLSPVNMRWTPTIGKIGEVVVQLGDQYGNPVQPGTALYATITGGLIQAESRTDEFGRARFDVSGGYPFPVSATRGAGYGIITVRTIGAGGTVLERNLQFAFTKSPIVSTPVDYSNFVIPDGGSMSFLYSVADENGNPLPFGNQVEVTLSGAGADDVSLTGQTLVTFQGDTVKGTTYAFTIADKVRGFGRGGALSVKIEATGSSGSHTRIIDGSITGIASQLATITLKSISAPQISVRGTGANETSILTFEARDSLGNVLSLTKKSLVNFSLTGPAGGEFITPTSDSTGADGLVSTTLVSGTQAGVVQVIASATVGGNTIVSAPTKITITGGLPDSNRFTASLTPLNMRGLVSTAQLGQVEVQLGDQFGNPVQAGTALYFSTTGGLIQPFATTDANGKATVAISGGNPEPTTPGRGAGYGKITVQTIGAGGVTLKKELPFLFSGAPIVSTGATYDGFLIPDGAAQTFTYTVADKNGNPLSAGNQVSVTLAGKGASEVALTGQTNVTFTDDTTRGSVYSFTLADNAAGSGSGGPVEISITANGPSGSYVKKITGSMGAPGTVEPPIPVSRTPARITFVSVSSPAISVAGVGALENSVITYEVQDSLGRPMDNISRAYATFDVQWFPNSRWSGGTAPSVLPAADSTDAQGRVRASVVSGTQAGVLQVLVKIDIGGGTIIRSEPVRISVYAGFPDQAHFTLASTRYVFPTASIGSPATTLAVAVGDTFSNPVSVGTAVYFHSQAGVTQTGALTNNLGQASTSFFTVNPTPTTLPYYKNDPGYGPGYFYITAQTQGRFGTEIKDSILVYWAVGPVQITGLPDSIQIIRGSISPVVNFSATDGRGKPLPDGTSISVSVTYVSDVTGISFGTTGNLPATIPAAPYAILNQVGITDFNFRVVDQSTGGGAPLGLPVTIEIVVDSPGLGRVVQKILGRIV